MFFHHEKSAGCYNDSYSVNRLKLHGFLVIHRQIGSPLLGLRPLNTWLISGPVATRNGHWVPEDIHDQNGLVTGNLAIVVNFCNYAGYTNMDSCSWGKYFLFLFILVSY